MIRLRKIRIGQVALMISVSTLFVTGIAVAASGQISPIAEEIEAAVDSGDITREEADAKHLKVRERLAEDIKERSRAIEAAVVSGELTREEADARHLQIKKRLAESGQGFDEKKGDKDRVSLEDIKERSRAIEAAVVSGEVTREEADARHLQIKKRLAESERIYSSGDRLVVPHAR